MLFCLLGRGAHAGAGARAVWVGDCLIGQAARGTDTYELNRNLVLTEGAKADSVPNLEIENGNIEGAGHASATGRFDDQQLFYLRARGIPETEARRLVVLGFFNEIVAEIGVDEVEERLMAAIEKELELTGLIAARTDQDPVAVPAAAPSAFAAAFAACSAFAFSSAISFAVFNSSGAMSGTSGAFFFAAFISLAGYEKIVPESEREAAAGVICDG